MRTGYCATVGKRVEIIDEIWDDEIEDTMYECKAPDNPMPFLVNKYLVDDIREE